MFLILEACEEAGLAESIALEKFHVRQQVQHCRDEHRVGRAFALDQLTETFRGELWNRDLARTESRCREHGGKISNVKNRCRMQIDTAFSVSHPIAEVVEVRQDVGVTHHDTLRPARRATGIDESENRFRVIDRIWTGVVPTVQGLFIKDEVPRKMNRRRSKRGMPHQPAWFCIKQNTLDFGCGEPCIYRYYNNAEPTAGVDQLDVLRRIRQQKREAVARRKTVGGERSRNVPDALVDRLETNSGTFDNQRRALRVIPECPAERMNINHVLFTPCDTAPLSPRECNGID